jgi:hypothetical protein
MSRAKTDKRAMIEVQFNWILIIIIGAIILVFFISVFNWYKDSKNREMAIDAKTKLSATLAGAQLSTNTASVIDVPDVSLVFSCDPSSCGEFGCDSSFQFGDTGIGQQTPVDVIFATDQIETNQLLTWSLPWKTPYKAADFLYLSNPSIRYIIVYNESEPASRDLAEDVYAGIASCISVGTDECAAKVQKQIISSDRVSSITDQNDYFVKFVLFYEPAGNRVTVHDSLAERNNWDVLAVSGETDYGTLSFAKPGSDSSNRLVDTANKQQYLGLPALFGAIFSQSPDYYNCNMKKAYKRMQMVNQVYWKRTMLLGDMYAGDQNCEFVYDDALISTFEDINTILTDMQGPGAAADDLDYLKGYMSELEDANSIALRNGCPRIY